MEIVNIKSNQLEQNSSPKLERLQRKFIKNLNPIIFLELTSQMSSTYIVIEYLISLNQKLILEQENYNKCGSELRPGKKTHIKTDQKQKSTVEPRNQENKYLKTIFG